jgi:Amt family ammonium transporter
MPLVALGTFILWLGWFGFNPGSTMAAGAEAIAHIVLTTNMAAAVGAVVATLYTWMRVGKPDVGLTCNGALAGLVGITAPCAYVTGEAAMVIGVVAGVVVVEGVMFFDKRKLDDPVGATSVHLLCGIWGTLALGLFADPTISKNVAGVETAGLFYGGGATQLIAQCQGILAVGAFTFGISFIVWYALKVTIGIRVSAEDEQIGLDISEMGMEAYPDEMARGTSLGSAQADSAALKTAEQAS